MDKKNILNNVALFIALLFHVSGVIGILFTPYKDWFIQNTYINLLLMAVLLIITHPSKNKNFFLFLLATFIIGIGVEIFGVNTGLFFGKYSYGNILGFKILDVPLLIGVNWFIIMYCTGMMTQAYENYMLRKMNERGINVNTKMKFISFITDAALLGVLFDWIMEPVAQKLGYWQWENSEIPIYNYICWIIVSALFLTIFKKLNLGKLNKFAVHLFLIQLLFFLVLRTFL